VSGQRTGSLSSLRELNRLKVLEVVRERGAVSRAEIATATGLARSTVSMLVSEMLRAGIAVERDADKDESGGGAGRPPTLVSLDPGAAAVIGIHFAHDSVRVAIADLGLTLLGEDAIEADVDDEADTALDAAATLVARLIEENDVPRDRLIGAGVAVSAPIDRRDGHLSSSTILPGWNGVDAAAHLSERLGVRVIVDNDANLGALAESVLGAGRGASEMVYLMLSAGIGGALILEGRLYRGARGIAGEFGHVSVDEDGLICRCGNRGCLETIVGTGALIESLRRSHGDITVERMIALASAGDPGCQRVLADAGHAVGRVIAGVCNQFNPERLVVGGDLSVSGDYLLIPMQESIRRHALPAASEGLTIVAGELGERAELMGALTLLVGQSERVLTGRLRMVAEG
jgi:predicted NBD/HSP70 family sugar kinase